MLILFSLILSAGFVTLSHKTIKSRPKLFYVAAVVITLIVGIFDFSFLPVVVQNTLLGIFTRGAFATALWIIIMWTGALPNGSWLIRKLMPIRGELSIFAAILTLGHNVFYGKIYFVRLFTNISILPWTQLTAAILSIVMILLLLPLTVTSFPSVRKKIPAKKWKKLQRWAYLYYGLLYAHIMLVTMPGALAGKFTSIISVIVYTAVFLSYTCFRIRKYLMLKKKADPQNTLTAAVTILLIGMLLCGIVLYAGSCSSDDLQESVDEQIQHESISPEASSEQDNSSRTISGHAYGYDGEVYVNVTVENGEITDITGYTEESDDFYFNRCYEKIVSAILETQNCEVDAVSGATYSSQAIMDAVESALKQVK